jgi:predicted extracellular nuclease
VISQIYGGGGNTGAPYSNDFTEIFNAGNQPVSLTGWSIQYAPATSTSWTVTPLSTVTLQPGQYYLIQEASGGTNGIALPTPDATGSTAMAATAGKVALVNSTTALNGSGCPFAPTVVDFIGYGSTADCREGSSSANNAPAPSNTAADLRAGVGCTDTELNSTDFATGAPNPRNTGSGINQCLLTFTPDNGIDELAWLNALSIALTLAGW